MNRTFKMHTKILLLCLGVTFFALIFQMILFQQSSSRMIYEQAKNESFHSLQNMQEDVYNLIKGIEKVLIESYNEREFIQDLKNEKSIKQMRNTYSREAYNIATNNFETTDGVVALYLYNVNNEIISTYRRAVTPRHKYPTDIYAEESTYNSAIVKEYVQSDNTRMLISSYYNTAREKEIIRYVLKLYNNGNAKDIIGYVVCDVDSKNLTAIIEKYSNNENMYLWFQPTGDRPAACVGTLNADEVSALEDFQKSIQSGKEGDKTTIESGNRVFFHLEQDKYNFGAYSLMPQEMFYANQRILAHNLILILVAMFAVAVVVTYVVTKTLTKPLENMTVTAKKIKEGDTKLRMEVLEQDEIGILGQNFNDLLDTIEDLISEEYKTKLLLNRAEYNALQAQINPHFLYNTLDTMGSIAEMQECRQVSALCQSLSNIFRYSLDMKHPFSTVAKEMVHLKNYIYVMDVRMRDHINYQFDIEEEVLKAEIPRLSIQPIVENALNHGLRNSRKAKEVCISAKAEGELMEIIVKDNGVGMSEEKIKSLFDTEGAENTGETEGKKSIGIQNIHMRMKMFYGEEYGIEIESKEGEGTCVKLRIPQKAQER
ncbi:MAG: histidine kinase [Lachnospiraceae bacterium]|nr:histidine kinase [Lachnospiraceae bacterium]